MSVATWMLAGCATLLFAGPPKLPDLPRRGMRNPAPDPEPAPTEPPSPARPETPAAPQSPGRPQAAETPASSTAPQSPKPATPTVPGTAMPTAVGGERPVAQRPSPIAAGAAGTQLGPLPAASDADYAAWADDDGRAAAPLSGESAPPHRRAARPGDRPAKHAGAGSGTSVVVRQAEPQPERAPRFARAPGPPKRTATVVLAYRNFALADALGRRQSWHFGSVEFTPLRRYARLNLLTEAGVEGGEAAAAGDRADFMVLQKLGLGAQYPHWVTPFIELQGGIGVARLEVFERNDLGLVWTVGIDVGAQWAVTRWFSIHAAVGWIHPVIRTKTVAVQFDRAAFKVGVGF